MSRPPVVMLSGVRWDAPWQRHHSLATLFARAGYPTVFVETTGLSNPRLSLATLRKVTARVDRSGEGHSPASGEENLTIYSPLVAPPTAEVFRGINAKLLVPKVAQDLGKLISGSPIVVAYPPTRTTLDIIAGLRPRLLFYDRADDYGAFPRVPKDIAATERELLHRADLISCTSKILLNEVRSLRPDAFLSGPAVDYERFAVLQNEGRGAVRNVAFFGDLSDERTDFEVFGAIARAGFGVRIVGTLGRVERGFLKTPGIEYRGLVPHERLPEALAGVDAFVLPYRDNRLTRSISPAKIFECLATGKPVISAPLPAMLDLGEHVYVADGPEGFVRSLRRLDEWESPEQVRARLDLAKANSWAVRFQEIETRILSALESS